MKRIACRTPVRTAGVPMRRVRSPSTPGTVSPGRSRRFDRPRPQVAAETSQASDGSCPSQSPDPILSAMSVSCVF